MKKELLLTAAVLAAVTLPAFADTNTNNGAGNVINDNSGIGNGNTTISTNSNNPSLTANGGNSSATGGNASSKSSANSRNTNLQGQKQGQVQSQKATSSVRSSGNSSNSYATQAQARNPVSTAFAAPLVADNDTCMGSSSAGGQGVGFGLSLGTTWHDKDCVRRKDARELHNMGQRKAALALLCQSESVAEAMRTAGTPCPGREEDTDLASEHHRDDRLATANGEEVIYEYPTNARRW